MELQAGSLAAAVNAWVWVIVTKGMRDDRGRTLFLHTVHENVPCMVNGSLPYAVKLLM